MKSAMKSGREGGMALAVSLLFLLVVTVISTVAASNSAMGLKIAGNVQDAVASFQSAEAGIVAVMLQVNTAQDVFDRGSTDEPFAGFDAGEHPLRHLKDDVDSVDVDVHLTGSGLECPAMRDATSASDRMCDFYRIESEHVAPNQARTKVDQGAVKPLIRGG